MGKHSLEEFIKKENEGVVFAKITKSFKSNDVHGNYFSYEDYIGKIINSKVNPLFKWIFLCGNEIALPEIRRHKNSHPDRASCVSSYF